MVAETVGEEVSHTAAPKRAVVAAPGVILVLEVQARMRSARLLAAPVQVAAVAAVAWRSPVRLPPGVAVALACTVKAAAALVGQQEATLRVPGAAAGEPTGDSLAGQE